MSLARQYIEEEGNEVASAFTKYISKTGPYNQDLFRHDCDPYIPLMIELTTIV